MSSDETVTPAAPGEPTHHDLHNTSWLALLLAFIAAIAFFIGFSIAAGDPEATCKWCEPNAFDEAVRSLVFLESSRTVGHLSHVLSMVIAPGLAIAAAVIPGYRSPKRGHGNGNLAMVFTPVIFSIGMADGVKKIFLRERPGFHHGRAALLEASNIPLERNVSFFSGDTAIAFTFIAAAFVICALRGYQPPRWLKIAAVAVAVSAAFLRVAADMHWATDVIAGAAVGIAFGAGIPFLLHRRRPA
jgi:membrane-associated phospholipid phosphatase